MAQKNKAALEAAKSVIENETLPGKNTTTRNANMLQDLIDSSFLKLEDIAANAVWQAGTSNTAAIPTPAQIALAIAALAPAGGGPTATKDPCRVATIGNINLANPAVTDIDGITMGPGERVLVRAQGILTENGIYIFDTDSTPMVRALDADQDGELDGAVVIVQEGATFADKFFKQDSDNTVIGTTNIVWSELAGGSVTVDDVTIEDVGALQVKDAGIVAAKIATNAVTTAKIAAGAVTTAEIVDDAVSTSKIQDDAVDTSQIAPLAVTESELSERNQNDILVPRAYPAIFSRFDFEEETPLVAPAAAPTVFDSYDLGNQIGAYGFTEPTDADFYLAVISTAGSPSFAPTNDVIYIPPGSGLNYNDGQLVSPVEFIAQFSGNNAAKLLGLLQDRRHFVKIYAAKKAGSKIEYFLTALAGNLDIGTIPANFNPEVMWWDVISKGTAEPGPITKDGITTTGATTWENAYMLNVGFTGDFQLRWPHWGTDVLGDSAFIGVMDAATPFNPLAATYFAELEYAWFLSRDIGAPYNHPYRRYTAGTNNGTSTKEWLPTDFIELAREGNELIFRNSPDGITYTELATQGRVTMTSTGNKKVVMITKEATGYLIPHPLHYIDDSTSIITPTF